MEVGVEDPSYAPAVLCRSLEVDVGINGGVDDERLTPGADEVR